MMNNLMGPPIILMKMMKMSQAPRKEELIRWLL